MAAPPPPGSVVAVWNEGELQCAVVGGEEKQKLKVQRLQKELATGMKAAETASTSAAAAEAERRAALERAEAAESTVAMLERRVQMVVEAARGGKAAMKLSGAKFRRWARYGQRVGEKSPESDECYICWIVIAKAAQGQKRTDVINDT